MIPPTLAPGPLTVDFQKAIDKYLANVIPPDKSGAVLGVVTPTGVQFGAAVRVGQNWKLAAGVDRAWSGETSGQVVVMGSW